ncbi:MAG: hypothetical protein J6T57_03030 [Alphaproteobacteria bacterium]|nr:hypothetical protein [Alphaproteobacteria bacterium]
MTDKKNNVFLAVQNTNEPVTEVPFGYMSKTEKKAFIDNIKTAKISFPQRSCMSLIKVCQTLTKENSISPYFNMAQNVQRNELHIILIKNIIDTPCGDWRAEKCLANILANKCPNSYIMSIFKRSK